MKLISSVTEFVVGTRTPPARDGSVHQSTDHRHWDREAQSWVEHTAAGEADQAA